MSLDPGEHLGHSLRVYETSSTTWFVNVAPKEKTLEAYDYSSGDGVGDYSFECLSCGVEGPLPEGWEMRFL